MVAAAPALQAKGIIPLSVAEGWPLRLLIENLTVAIAGVDNFVVKIYKGRDLAVAGRPRNGQSLPGHGRGAQAG